MMDLPKFGTTFVQERRGIAAVQSYAAATGLIWRANGCVSIRDYDRFLTAFQRGEIKRLIVVPTSADIPRSMASL
jgi:hypothetical protein